VSISIASASELCVSYSSQTVLDGATLAIHENERIGLVGRNGCGKSTFLKIIAQLDVPDSGEYSVKRGLRVGYLPQDFELDEDANVMDAVLTGAQDVMDMITEYDNNPADSIKAAELMDLISHRDGWNLEPRAQSLLTNLHAPDTDRIISTLSGGEKRRVALCRALLGQPELLILDEPTNHLDTGSIEWLEVFLSRYTGCCLFVTHDRYFLDRIANRIVEISGGKCVSYEGNYTEYMITRAERMEAEAVNEHKRQRFLKKELEWVRRRPSARRTKSRDRMDKYFEIADQEAPEEELDIDLIIPPAPKLSNRVVECENISYTIEGRTLFKNLDFKLEGGERIGVVGKNGMGKSTLLKTILGQLTPHTGKVMLGARAEINFVDQGRLILDDQKSIFEEVGEGTENVRLGDETIGLRAYLRRFLFDDDRINTKIALLSGGERSRVLLAKILKRGGNVLVLDEPTNDLDLNTLRLLEEALVNFAGSVLVVSHDRYFLNRVCTGILAFEDNGDLHFQDGSYDYYLEKKSERDKQNALNEASFKTVKTGSTEPKKTGRKLKWKEERELETIEADILAAEEDVAAKETILTHPNFYNDHPNDWQQYETQLNEAKATAAKRYARWDELEKIKAESAS
jgi:ATP-binding cassette subfamily F protein uup|tara:strand:+ start:474 stop:2360 length:1887 start_codon:yes stop_codon:yes gene_type:complete